MLQDNMKDKASAENELAITTLTDNVINRYFKAHGSTNKIQGGPSGRGHHFVDIK